MDTSARAGEMTARVGYNVRRLRQGRRITLAKMAEGLARYGVDLSMTGLQKLETGARAITVDQLAAMASYLGVDPAVLMADPKAGRRSQDVEPVRDVVCAPFSVLTEEQRRALVSLAEATVTPAVDRLVQHLGAEVAALSGAGDTLAVAQRGLARRITQAAETTQALQLELTEADARNQ